jgi:hypothetical protein
MIDGFTSLVLAMLVHGSAPQTGARSVEVAQTATDGDTSVEKRALRLLAELQAGTIDRNELSPDLSAAYTKSVLALSKQTIPAGSPATVVQLAKHHVDGATTYVYRLTWPSGTLDYTFGYDDASFAVVQLYVRTGPPV